jgi:anti-sigma-K factor RskA
MSEDHEDSAAAHALNALPADESLSLDAAMELDPDLRADYEAHRAVAAELVEGFSDVVPAQSPHLWDRIAESAGFAPEVQGSSSPGLSSRFRRWAPIFVGTAALAVAIAMSANLLMSRSQTPGLDAVAGATADLPGSITVTLVDPAGGTNTAEAVVSPTGQGFVDGERLPTLPENRTYQLWAIIEDRVVSVGLMGNRPSLSAFRVEGPLAGLAISAEKLGGVVVSETEPVAVWLDQASQ